jgi:hypothetical protein
MIVDISSIDREQFMVHEHTVNGELMYLVQPQHIGVKWTAENKIFRSSLWNKDGYPVSLCFYKFPNWGEQPEVFPVPTNLKKCTFVQKVDGSTLILSRYKGNYVIRTRGTTDASLMEKNGFEVELFKTTILPKITDCSDTWNYSILFEWVSPLNRVVLLYPEPKWYLIGVVNHDDYSLMPQKELNEYAAKMGWERPPLYSFEFVNTFTDLIGVVEAWKGVEGIVVYSGEKDGILHKIKGLDYLARHRLKSELSSFEKLIDFWVTIGTPSVFSTFWSEVEKLTDYETAQEHFGDISRIIDGWKEVQQIIDGMNKFVNETLKPLPTRKDQALKVIASYSSGNSRANMVFSILDKKPLTTDQKKKLLYQVLKK